MNVLEKEIFKLAGKGQDCKNIDLVIDNVEDCKKAAKELGLKYSHIEGGKDKPAGCWKPISNKAIFNRNTNPAETNPGSVWQGICWIKHTKKHQYKMTKIGEHCAKDMIVDTEEECIKAADDVGLKYVKVYRQPHALGGCWYTPLNLTYFNTHVHDIPKDYIFGGGVCKINKGLCETLFFSIGINSLE